MRIIILTAIVLASLGTTLYQVKTGIDERQAELRHLQAEIATTQRDIAVLEAEWAFLSRPDRVMNLSASLLDMEPISRDRILPLEAIPMRFPADTESLDRVSCVKC
ncbi:MAG: cell division protein FtsL [Candidatus Puniceispirillaceae bacterium]